jgi:hypothetical protein
MTEISESTVLGHDTISSLCHFTVGSQHGMLTSYISYIQFLFLYALLLDIVSSISAVPVIWGDIASLHEMVSVP